VDNRHSTQKKRWPYGRGTSVKFLKDTCGLPGPVVQGECSTCSKDEQLYSSNVSGPTWSLLEKITRFVLAKLSVGFFKGFLLIIAPVKEQ